MKMYEPTWESLDSRPLPNWYDKAKFGIFIHWGPYAVPAYAPKRYEVETTGEAYSEWYGWQVYSNKMRGYYNFHKRVYGEHYPYANFATSWKAELFDPDKWCKLFQYAGAKYLVPVTKHHDAFCLWNSYYSPKWNSVDVGPQRDIISELMESADKYGLIRGAYYSILEWWHPVMQIEDVAKADISRYAQEKMIPQLKEMVEKFHPHLIFSDGEGSYWSDQWHTKEFLSWLYNESSVKDQVVVNDRWGRETRGAHGGYFTTEYGEVNSPTVDEKTALEQLSRIKWEEDRSIGKSFGFNRNEDIEDYMTEKELVQLLVTTVCKGGNFLLNVGPCADGTLSPIIQERLVQLGDWMQVNGKAIYESKPGEATSVHPFTYTKIGDTLYAFTDQYPKNDVTIIGKDVKGKTVTLLGSDVKIAAKAGESKISFNAPHLYVDEMPCRHVYVFEIK